MKQLHIVSLDIPFPADYGGAIDIFYKIKALAALNIEITLHCFKYGSRKEQADLEKYCKNVFYYQRKTGYLGLSTGLPYIVYSRRNTVLLQRLKNANGAVLFEGLHTCYYLNHPDLKAIFKIVRCHNIEHEYYTQLSKNTTLLKKTYFKEEGRRLKKFESILNHAQVILPISQTDFKYFSKRFKSTSVHKLTPFHSNVTIDIKTGSGDYLLYHGSLDSPENEKSALFIVDELAPHISSKIIICGSNPSIKLVKACTKRTKVELISNPSQPQLEALIKNAQIHLMYATQKSGLKLKFLKSLYSGRHVIANDLMASVDDLKDCAHKANTAMEWITLILKLNDVPFTSKMIETRTQQLLPYATRNLANRLFNLIN